MNIKFKFIKYRYRYFFLYIIIGIISISVELLIYNIFIKIGNHFIVSSIFSLLIGITASFWLNVKYNFKISTPKRNKSLIYFLIISFVSYLSQVFLINKLDHYASYEILRFSISGCLFWLAYILHRRFSFYDYKKVGVAIYSDGVEDIRGIYQKVEDYPDFIHIDIVDKTFNKKAKKVLSYKSEVIKAYWNNKFIESHIMSRMPMKWVKEIINNVDRIYIHQDIDENIIEIANYIKNKGCSFGLVIQDRNELDNLEKFSYILDSILVLAIDNPGYSGQDFNYSTIDLIKKINSLSWRKRVLLNIDGGINNKNIDLINSENVVSGSYVIKSKDPIKNIMTLQTSSKYE